MATTSPQGDFDRIKGWGKAFLTAEVADIDAVTEDDFEENL